MGLWIQAISEPSKLSLALGMRLSVAGFTELPGVAKSPISREIAEAKRSHTVEIVGRMDAST